MEKVTLFWSVYFLSLSKRPMQYVSTFFSQFIKYLFYFRWFFSFLEDTLFADLVFWLASLNKIITVIQALIQPSLYYLHLMSDIRQRTWRPDTICSITKIPEIGSHSPLGCMQNYTLLFLPIYLLSRSITVMKHIEIFRSNACYWSDSFRLAHNRTVHSDRTHRLFITGKSNLPTLDALRFAFSFQMRRTKDIR